MPTLTDLIETEVARSPRHPWLKALYIYLFRHGGRRCLLIYRIASHLHRCGHRRLARYCFDRLQKDFGVYIHPDAEIGPGLRLPHPVGIVIGQGVKIGRNAVIYQNSTLGGARRGDSETGNYPQIGDDCLLFAGAVVIGGIRIGDGCTVAANAVVTRDIASHTTVAGVPARPLRSTAP